MPAVPWLFHLPQQFLSGKPLGTRYKPCKTASEGIFAPRSNGRPCVSSPLHPEGSRYWHAQSHTRSSISPTTSSHTPQHDQTASKSFTNHSSGLYYVYTFFSTSVSSSPAYSFPPRHPSIHPTSSESQPPQQPYQPQYRPRSFQFQQRPQVTQPNPQIPSPFSRSGFTAGPAANLNNEINDDNDDSDPVPEITFVSDSQPERPATPAFTAENLAPINEVVIFDRVMTASPTSLSEYGDTGTETQMQSRLDDERQDVYAQYQYQMDVVEEGYQGQGYRYGPTLDPDGEFVAEPDSPDKTGEVMLLPER